MKAVRIFALGVVAIAAGLLAAGAQALDSHRQPGPAHGHASLPPAAVIASSPRGQKAKPIHPATVTAAHGPTFPTGGDPRVQLNPQPIPPGHSRIAPNAVSR